jgi:hypothetical protein
LKDNCGATKRSKLSGIIKMNVNDSSDVYENFPQQGAARDESPSVHTADAPDSKLRAKESFDDLGSFGECFRSKPLLPFSSAYNFELGKLQLLEKLGEGAFGHVWKARRFR